MENKREEHDVAGWPEYHYVESEAQLDKAYDILFEEVLRLIEKRKQTWNQSSS